MRPSAHPRIACLILNTSATEFVDRLWEALGCHSPQVERAAEGSPLFYLDARGIVPRYRSEEHWCQAVRAEAQTLGIADARLGVAATRFAAWVAAQSAPPSPGYQLVVGPDARFLAPLLPDWLPLDPETLRRLRILGIGTIGRFAALPENAVIEQFGPESHTSWRWSRGQDDRPVMGRRCQTLEASYIFDSPEARYETLVETAVYLSERALRDLPVARQAWAIRRISIEALTVERQALTRSVWLGDTAGHEVLHTRLGQIIAGLRGESEGIAELKVSLLGLEPAIGQQLNLFESQETDRHWQQVVTQLTRKHSADCLLRATLVDPEAAILPQRYAFRALQP